MSEALKQIALVGMPNVGKTALFNVLTGKFQKVANFAGVTVEKKSAEVGFKDKSFELVDLPGLYSLDAATLDEKITKDILSGKREEKLHHIVLVADATSLEKSLFIAYQLKNANMKFTLAINLSDQASKRGLKLDLPKLEEELKAKVFLVSAASRSGVEELKSYLFDALNEFQILPSISQDYLRKAWSIENIKEIQTEIEATLKTVIISPLKADSLSEKIDSVVLNPFLGFFILIAILVFIFEALFSWSAPLQDFIEMSFLLAGDLVHSLPLPHLLESILVEGVIAGVGGVMVFLPQIILLFLFIQLLEDVGYMARAAFLMDAFMRKLGLPGKTAIPFLSSHACAIPGIMATRILESPLERLISMMVIPITTCSARLPVYTLLIAAIVPAQLSFYGFSYQALFMLALYGFALFMSIILAILFRNVLPKSEPSMLMMELPPYRLPNIKNLMMVLKNRAMIFIKKAGKIILLLSLVIWLLVNFPRENLNEAPVIETSYAAQIGKFFEPIFSPLGFDWKITTALIPSFGAREIVVSSLSTVFAVQESEAGLELQQALQKEYSLATLMALIAWFVFAPQCISTIAILKRETNSWRWPIGIGLYTLALAYFAALLVYQLFST